MFNFVKWVVTVLTLSAILAFMLFNSKNVHVNWAPFYGETDMALPLLTILFFAFGFLASAVIFWLNAHPQRAELRRLRKENRQLERSLKEERELSARKTKPAPEDLYDEKEEDFAEAHFDALILRS